MSGPRERRWLAAEAGLIAALCLLYLTSFPQDSAVHGPWEVFGQDSVYIVQSLERGEPYPWNPQSHLLYHFVIERGYELWRPLFGSGAESVYRFLKLFGVLCGAGFLAGMCWLFRELGVRGPGRLVLLLLAGVSVSAWFHFSAFETHCLAMPPLALYLVALARLRNRPARTRLDRVLLIGSLLLMGMTRVDLARFAAVSALLPLLPALWRHARSLVVDLVLVAVLWGAGNACVAWIYLDVAPGQSLGALVERKERKGLEEGLRQISNLDTEQLLKVGRAVTLYSILMPIEGRPPDRSFLAPPINDRHMTWSGKGGLPSNRLFRRSAMNMLGSALSLVALAGLTATLLWTAVASARRLLAGDAFHVMLAAQAVFGWLLYTWFNPFEPFLWIAEFMPLWIAMLADDLRGRGRAFWIALVAVALCAGAHNWFALHASFAAPMTQVP